HGDLLSRCGSDLGGSAPEVTKPQTDLTSAATESTAVWAVRRAFGRITVEANVASPVTSTTTRSHWHHSVSDRSTATARAIETPGTVGRGLRSESRHSHI